MGKPNEMPQPTNNVSQIGAGTKITGDIECAGDLRIDGAIEGKLNVRGKMVIGNGGRLNGEANCRNADISGSLEGKINVQELLSLKATSTLKGDIVTKRLSIEPGSVFTGTCTMGERDQEPRA